MKTAEFTTEFAEAGKIEVPPEIAAQVPNGEQLHVVLCWGVSDDDALWRAEGRKRFDTAFAPEDSIYESLIDDSSAG